MTGVQRINHSGRQSRCGGETCRPGGAGSQMIAAFSSLPRWAKHFQILKRAPATKAGGYFFTVMLSAILPYSSRERIRRSSSWCSLE